MASDRQKVIDIALEEDGYLEKATTEQLDEKTANAGNKNYTKYARDLADVRFFNGRKQGTAWCSVFVAWCFFKAYGKAAALALLCQPSNAANNCGAGCKFARGYFKAKGQLYTSNPQAGDVIFFYSKDKSSISHTGIVYKVDSTYVYTVEGNTSSASGVVANGGAVAKKKYSHTYNRLAGYGRPAYGNIGTETGTGAPATKDEQEPSKEPGAASAGKTEGKAVTVTLTTLRNGSTGAQVKTLQRLLSAMDYYNGETDGKFGISTAAAVKAFQRAKRLTVDGIVGKNTWTALLK